MTDKPSLEVGDLVLFTAEKHRPYVSRLDPGKVTEVWEERDDQWWVRTNFEVEHWAPVEDWTAYCTACKAQGGWWECKRYGRICTACSCNWEHTWTPCPEQCTWYEETLD